VCLVEAIGPGGRLGEGALVEFGQERADDLRVELAAGAAAKLCACFRF
jgi:hypothetical protein